MILSIENGELRTSLECRFHNLLDVGALDPIPSNICASDDARLSDQRVPLDGSVTNAKVATNAAIIQSKLNLNGVIPPAWLGTTATTAAKGSLAEYKSNKAVPNGYASLDGAGKIPVSQIPALAGVGTVTSVALSLPGTFTVTGSPVTSSGTLTAAWASAPALSWFGNNTASAAPPAFRVSNIPVALIPSLDASIIVTGIFDPGRLPVAVYGASHARGAVPDPGVAGGNANQYLSRDMTYKDTPTSAKVTFIVTGSGNWTPDAGARSLFIECWGAGGGGGGAVSPGALFAAAGGGGGGGYASKWYPDAAYLSTYPYAIGTGGVGGAAGLDGNDGQVTSFDGFNAFGGSAGLGDPTGGTVVGAIKSGGLGGQGGTAADLAMTGGDGGESLRLDATHGRGGPGGDGAIGGGGSKGRFTAGPGINGNIYGGGGSGAVSVSTTGYQGGNGAKGAIRITQYF
jgi:hypothetical protein